MIELREASLQEMELKKKININKLKTIDISGRAGVLEVDPLSIISHRRFDIMAKYIYAWFKENHIDSDWGTRLYDEHIRVFNNYDEGDGSEKKGITSFLESFASTLESIKENGFNENITLIPIGKNNEPLDGAHRIAAALLYNKKIKVVKFSGIERNYNYSFFTDRGLDSMDCKYSDAIAYEYCKIKLNTYIVVLFPSAVGRRNETREILKKYGDIFYEKDIIVGNEGPKNIIMQLYKDEPWLGDFESNFQGAMGKVEPCFKGSGPLKVIVFETDDFNKVLKAKQEIRDLYNIDKHSVHINDTHEETIELAQLFFNENSIYFLNNARPYSNKRFCKLLNAYKNILSEYQMSKEYFCLGSDSVMAAYGIQNTSSLDVTYYGDNNIFSKKSDIVRINIEMNYYKATKDDIIFNPENHFYFDGIKFASIEIVKKDKENSGLSQDRKDIRLINKYFKGKGCVFKLRLLWRDTKKTFRRIAGKAIRFLYSMKQHNSNN